MNISFGKKIPITNCSVYDKQKQAFVNATMYELDGKDKEDLDYLIYQKGNWGILKCNIMTDFFDKQQRILSKKELSPLETFILNAKKFYTLETQNDKSIGLCEVMELPDSTNIHFLECNPDKTHKFAGQVLLASIAKNIIKKDCASLTVNDPAESATDFYINKCGFTPSTNQPHKIEMNKEQMEHFVQQVEQRTQNPIVNILV